MASDRQEARSAASSCDQPMRGLYGATTICARPAGHIGKHDPIWNHEDWPNTDSAARDHYESCWFGWCELCSNKWRLRIFWWVGADGLCGDTVCGRCRPGVTT